MDMGRIRKHESADKTAIFILKNASKRNMIEIKSDSPYITAEMTPSPTATGDSIAVRIALSKDMPPGKINATLTATVSDSSYAASTLHVRGTIIGNYDVNPEIVRFSIARTLPLEKQEAQEIRLVSTVDGADLQVLGIADRENRLTFDINTATAGRQYVIKARPNESAMKLERNTAGEIILRTNDADQPEFRIRYSMIFPK